MHDTILSLNAKTGAVVWKKYYPGTARNAVCYDKDNVYASFEQYFYCLDANTGKFKWQFEAGFFIESAPTIAGNTIWIGADDYLIYAINRNTGERAYFITTGSTSFYTLVNNESLFSLSVYGEFMPMCMTQNNKTTPFCMSFDREKLYQANNKITSLDSPPYISSRTMVP